MEVTRTRGVELRHVGVAHVLIPFIIGQKGRKELSLSIDYALDNLLLYYYTHTTDYIALESYR